MKLRSLIILFVLLFNKLSFSQELNCQVKVITPQLQTVDPKVFKTLETSLYEFMNTQRWTNLTLKSHERIQCQFIITITDELSADQFNANISVVSSRPVHSSDYQSLVFNHQDKAFSFQYAEYQPIEFNENAFLNNLSSVMAYYAYMVIGFDFDTFSPDGGTPYFLKAQNIVNQAQNSAEAGWKPFENNRNRYWLVENVLNNKYKSLRRVYYDYHRKGMDKLYENAASARRQIYRSLGYVSGVASNYPSSIFLQVFINSKSDELIEVFKEADPSTRIKALNLLNKVDPTSSDKYAILKK